MRVVDFEDGPRRHAVLAVKVGITDLDSLSVAAAAAAGHVRAR
jgi:hypothetical protein